jgi:hypothetical protein
MRPYGTGLHANSPSLLLDLDEFPVARDLDENAVGDCLSLKAGPRGTEGQWDAMLMAEAEQITDLLDPAGEHDRLGNKAIETGIRRKSNQVDGTG